MNEVVEKIKKAGRAAFSTREYAALLGKKNYARLVLHRLKERQELIPIKNGWWAFPDKSPEAIACEVSKPAYISFHSALFLHGLTTQIPRKIQVAVARRTRNYSFEDCIVKEYKIKKQEFNGFCRKENLLLATPEKAFADCLCYPRSCPEVVLVESVQNVNTKDIEKFLSSKTAQKRLIRVIRNAKSERH